MLAILKGVVPIGIFMLKYCEGIYVYRQLVPVEAVKRLGPDLIYISAVLSAINLIHTNSSFYKIVNDVAPGDHVLHGSCFLAYIMICIVFWFVATHLYSNFAKMAAPNWRSLIKKLSLATSTLRIQVASWIGTLVIGVIFFGISLWLQ
jgi:hypothetical protein